jgi:hypothetical protein
MRYALAVVHIDQGRRREALELIETAPEWPEAARSTPFKRRSSSTVLRRRAGVEL